ncbi:hypothetical protein [uncultured Vagococcus sp.]|uniref:hypothetical protein n=1 Tax=uncultured Vagococcus sp. TaxID=189676 RepID=UPI0037DD02FF
MYMEDEAVLLMSEALEKNAIDEFEYPKTAEVENRCVNIIADLWNTPKICLARSCRRSGIKCDGEA